MTYQAQWALTYDDDFNSRQRAALTNQASIYKDDARPDIVALAKAVIRSEPASIFTSFQQLLGAAPSFADEADNGDGTIDSSKIADEEILSAVQAGWPTVAALYFDSTGSPITPVV
jgi:hypothetical protein